MNVVSAISQILKREFVLEVVCRFEKYSFVGLIDQLFLVPIPGPCILKINHHLWVQTSNFDEMLFFPYNYRCGYEYEHTLEGCENDYKAQGTSTVRVTEHQGQ